MIKVRILKEMAEAYFNINIYLGIRPDRPKKNGNPQCVETCNASLHNALSLIGVGAFMKRLFVFVNNSCTFTKASKASVKGDSVLVLG